VRWSLVNQTLKSASYRIHRMSIFIGQMERYSSLEFLPQYAPTLARFWSLTDDIEGWECGWRSVSCCRDKTTLHNSECDIKCSPRRDTLPPRGVMALMLAYENSGWLRRGSHATISGISRGVSASSGDRWLAGKQLSSGGGVSSVHDTTMNLHWASIDGCNTMDSAQCCISKKFDGVNEFQAALSAKIIRQLRSEPASHLHRPHTSNCIGNFEVPHQR